MNDSPDEFRKRQIVTSIISKARCLKLLAEARAHKAYFTAMVKCYYNWAGMLYGTMFHSKSKYNFVEISGCKPLPQINEVRFT